MRFEEPTTRTTSLAKLRGALVAPAAGKARHPRGRAVHIHVELHVGGSVVPIRGARRSRHDERAGLDLRQRREEEILAVAKSGTGYVGSIAMGVHK